MAEKRVQRRLAAILIADVVGYSRLMEADEEGTRGRLKSLYSELIDTRIAADGGRIVKTMGDGILVEFPSVVDAVRNALDIQGAMRRRNADTAEETRIEFRVGFQNHYYCSCHWKRKKTYFDHFRRFLNPDHRHSNHPKTLL